MRVHVDGRRGKWWLKLNSLLLSRLQPVARPDSPTLTAPHQALRPRPQVRRDYPLSLSISISGGKETYKDSPSNGERTGNSPALESGGSVVRIVVWRSVLSGGPAQVPWKGAPERVRAPSCPDPVAPRGAVYESGCLGMQPKSGGEFRPRLNTGERPIANKYREGKMKRTLKRESKSA